MNNSKTSNKPFKKTVRLKKNNTKKSVSKKVSINTNKFKNNDSTNKNNGFSKMVKNKNVKSFITKKNNLTNNKSVNNSLNNKVGNTIVGNNSNNTNFYVEEMLKPNVWVTPNHKEFVEWLNETFRKYQATGEKVPIRKGFHPFQYQYFLRDYMQEASPFRGLLLYHSLGSGKCHARDTPILMFDGSTKMVQDVLEGDILMGDDSEPRYVLSLARGRDKMYEIYYKGGSYTVNSEHILVLQNSMNEITEITVNDYLALSSDKQAGLYGYRASFVKFPEKKVLIEPYDAGKNLIIYNIDDYIVNSYEIRMKFLSGLIDRADRIHQDCYILQIPIKIVDKIRFLCFSLGIFIKEDLCLSVGEEKWIGIYGSAIQNSFFLKKKKLFLEDYENENYRFEIKVIEKPEDDYYGFVITGNNRYLLGDCVVTHNTCSAIQISENLKDQKNVVVMLPASLRTNFITKGLLFCADKKYQTDDDLYKEKYTFVSYNASNTTTQLKRLGSLDNKTIIIEEVHNLISKMVSGITGVSKQGLEIYNMLMEAQNTKIIALSGTPVVNDPFEAAVLFNILKGYMEVTYFRINQVDLKYGNRWDFTVVEQELGMHPHVDYIDFNKINKSIEFHLKVKSYNPEFQQVLQDINSICRSNGINVSFLEVKKFPLFPIDDDGDVFRNYFVQENGEKGDSMKNIEIFKRRILGLTSYYSLKDDRLPEIKHRYEERIPMSFYQFQMYEILRAKERLSERKSNDKSKKGKKVKSTFRVFSRQASNFVFPEDILRPYPDPTFVVSLVKKNKKENYKDVTNVMELEEKANEEGEISKEYKERIDTAINDLALKGDIYLKPGPDGLGKLSPKMEKMLQNIQQSPGLVFVYSNFRTVEGIEVFSKVLEFNGFSRYGSKNDLPKFAIYSGTEDETQKRDILKIFTSKENSHGKYIKIICATAAGAEGLDLKNIRQIHIMEPYWNQVRIEQVIGRGVRRGSHDELPPDERNIDIFRYFSVFTDKEKMETKDKMSTDEHIDFISYKKQGIINQVLLSMKETSIDCFLNLAITKPDYRCFSFGKNAYGISYYPQINLDIVKVNQSSEKKTIKKSLAKLLLFEKEFYLFDEKKKSIYAIHNKSKKAQIIDLKKAKPFYIDLDTFEVYDVKTTNLGNPVVIGYIDDNGKFHKRK